MFHEICRKTFNGDQYYIFSSLQAAPQRQLLITYAVGTGLKILLGLLLVNLGVELEVIKLIMSKCPVELRKSVGFNFVGENIVRFDLHQRRYCQRTQRAKYHKTTQKNHFLFKVRKFQQFIFCFLINEPRDGKGNKHDGRKTMELQGNFP